MKNEPLVSVIIRNYNYGRFLREAIDSALDQTYSSTEVIVVDDGSTDDSREIIADYGDRLIPVLKENGGQASAANTGFAVSRGEIVIFLDSDDILLPDIVGRVVAAFQANPDAVMVQYALQVVDAQLKLVGRLYPAVPPPSMPHEDLLQHILKFQSYPRSPTSGNAFASTALRRILPMPEDRYRQGAEPYIIDLARILGSSISLKEVGALYRQHGENDLNGISSISAYNRFMREDLPRSANNRAEQKRLFEALYSIKVQQVGLWDLMFWRDRMVSLKLDPIGHPFRDSLVSLCVRGCISSIIYPWIPSHRRPFYALWFLTMAAAPQTLADPLAQALVLPQNRRQLLNRCLIGARGVLRRGALLLFSRHRTSELRECARVTPEDPIVEPGQRIKG